VKFAYTSRVRYNDFISSIKRSNTMTEESAHRSESFKKHLPEDVRIHFQAAHEEMHKSLEGVLPPGFIEHRRAARKEMLLAFRGLLDHAIERIDEHAKKIG
jgi:hypothetical protein